MMRKNKRISFNIPVLQKKWRKTWLRHERWWPRLRWFFVCVFIFYLLANYLTRRLEHVGFYKQYFETAVKMLQEHGSCVLCRRNFESALERKNFQELVKSQANWS